MTINNTPIENNPLSEPEVKVSESEPKNQFLTKKSEVIAWLEKVGVKNYTIDKNLVVDVNGPVHIDGCFNLQYLPVQFGYVDGDFYCVSNGLLSLKGSPHYVEGNFNCGLNNLTSLIGGPSTVQGNYLCANNQLTSLKGIAQRVDELDCSKNKLTTLEDGPLEVSDGYDCSDNELISLKGCVAETGGNFDCSNNKLPNLQYGPRKVNGNYLCMGNQLRSWKGVAQVAQDLYVCFNPIKKLELNCKIEGDILLDNLKSLSFLSNHCNNEGLIDMSFEKFKKAILANNLYHKIDNQIQENEDKNINLGIEVENEVVKKLKI